MALQTTSSPVLTGYEPPSRPVRTRSRTSSRFSTEAESHSRPISIYSNRTSDTRFGRGQAGNAPSLSLFTSLRYASKFPDARSRSLRSTTTSLPSYQGKRDAATPVLDLTEKGQTGAEEPIEEHSERWSRFKWAMILSVGSIMIYSLVGLIVSLLYWFRGRYPRIQV